MLDTPQDTPAFVVHELELLPREADLGVIHAFAITRGAGCIVWLETAGGVMGAGTYVNADPDKAEWGARQSAYGRLVALLARGIRKHAQAAE